MSESKCVVCLVVSLVFFLGACSGQGKDADVLNDIRDVDGADARGADDDVQDVEAVDGLDGDGFAMDQVAADNIAMDEIDDDGFPVDEMTPDADAAGSDIADGDVADGDTTVVDVDDGFCHGWGDCEGLSVCDFALGRCEHRELLPAGALEVYTFKPSAAAAGDVIVLDGARFYYSLFGFMGMKVSFDDGAPFGVSGDENRVAWTYDGNSAGEHITLKSESGQATTEEPLLFANAGVIACDGKTPKATGVIPGNVDAAGPYAAAYFDLPSQNARLYCPAQCGSVRRPPIGGVFPVVALLHGDGGLYLNYEYLAQFLASWGFVSIMPEVTGTAALASLVNSLRGVDLGALSPALAGVATTEEIVLVGHSRGTARLEQITASSSDLRDATLASVFLGPVDDALLAPGLFMTFSATGDLQSNPSYSQNAYARQPAPKWHVDIQGGNHSLFTDHKVWFGMLSDLAPDITRTEQFRIVTRFLLPLCERAFALDEHFPDMLDAPPESPAWTVEFAL